MSAMKLIVNFNHPTNGAPIPYDHQYMVYSGILKCLSSVDSGLSDDIHSGAGAPSFVMSQLLRAGEKTFDVDGLFAERFVLLIASRNVSVLDKMREGLLKCGEIQLGKQRLPFHSAEIARESSVGSMPQLVTKSPVVIKSDGRFIRSDSKDFVNALKDNICRKYVAISGEPAPQIRFLRIVESKPKACRVGSTKIPCTHLKMVIDSDPRLIECMLTNGVGSKNQLGFGYIEDARSP